MTFLYSICRTSRTSYPISMWYELLRSQHHSFESDSSLFQGYSLTTDWTREFCAALRTETFNQQICSTICFWFVFVYNYVVLQCVPFFKSNPNVDERIQIIGSLSSQSFARSARFFDIVSGSSYFISCSI